MCWPFNIPIRCESPIEAAACSPSKWDDVNDDVNDDDDDDISILLLLLLLLL